MGFWNWIRTQATGVDVDAEQQRANELDALIAAENEKDYGPGGVVYNQTLETQGAAAANAQWEGVQARQAADNHPDISGEVGDAFQEGLQEGFDNTTGAIKSTLAAPFRFTFAALPWQVLVLGAAALFVYMGGWRWLRNRLL
jgi:hypothetical protein